MKRQLGMVLLLSLVSAGSAYAAGAGDRAGTRLDLSRSRSEARYGTVGNQPQTETTVTPPRVITVPVPDNSAAGQGRSFIAADRARPKTRRVTVPGTVTTVTRPAPVRVNPY
jgi:hypothetical protein